MNVHSPEQTRFAWPPVLAVALATFTVVTAEMMPVGILTPIAAALDVAPGVAGTSMATTGIVAAVVAALSPVLSGRLDKRTIMTVFLALVAVANVISATAPNFLVFSLGRMLIGVSMGFVWANAGSLGVRLSDERTVGRAMTTIFTGVSVGMVLGLPAGTFLAAATSWRGALWAVAALGAVAALAARTLLPSLPIAQSPGLAGLVKPWRDRGVRIGYLITALIIIGQFVAYTFVRPVLETGRGIDELTIVVALVVFGCAGIVGNLVIGTFSSRKPRAALLIAFAGSAAGAIALPFVVDSLVLVFGVLIIWGTSYGSISVATQSWNRVANPVIVNDSTAMLTAVFNASIAVGSTAGGIVFDGFGGTVVMLSGAAIMLLAWVTTFATRPTRA